MQIRFCGAAKAVTGSCHLIEFSGGKLLVDCGMRQGSDTKTPLGEDKFMFDPSEIDAVLLTHAHIDHSGLLPLLVKRGFKGSIYATSATSRLSEIMLLDSAHIQEGDAERDNAKRIRAGKKPIEPLYSIEDAEKVLKRFVPVEYETDIKIIDGVTARYNDIGHLLGSAAIELRVTESDKTTKIVFSGDVGRMDRPIIQDPDIIQSADYLVVEGTYGDRSHEEGSAAAKEAQFETVLAAAIARQGSIIIPSFAVGRTQEILYYIKKLIQKGSIPELSKIPIYVDSPLAIQATRIYDSCREGYYDNEAKALAASGSPFVFPNLTMTQTAEESKQINFVSGCKIVIASSGMCEAGRVRHHLKHNLYKKDTTIIFAGYQARGTLGRMICDGVKDVKLFGESIHVNATIEQLTAFSGHAGRDELITWIRAIQPIPRMVFLVHGEPEALDSLKRAIEPMGYSVAVPELGDVVRLAEAQTAVAEHDQQPAAQTDDASIRLCESLERIMHIFEGLSSAGGANMRNIMLDDIKALAERWEALSKLR